MEAHAGALDLRGFQGLAEEMRLEAAGGVCHYLLISRNGRHIKLSPTSYYLVKAVHEGRSFESLAREFSSRGAQAVSAEEIEGAYRNIGDQIAGIEARTASSSLPFGFWFVRRLIREETVARIASRLAITFHPLWGCLLAALAGSAFAWALRQAAPTLESQGASLWAAYALFIGSLLAHEIGHASACARFGAQPSEIGFTIYLVYPAFYSDVTSAWRLPRWQRVVVDLGGIFFQAIVGAAFVAAYWRWHWPPLLTATWMIWLSVLFSLNPVFRFDGYWVVSDSLGVTNLSRQPGLLAGYLFDRLRGRRRRSPVAGPWWLLAALSVYVVLAFFVWAAFLVRLGPFLVARLVQFPEAVRATFHLLLRHGWSRESFSAISELVALTLLLTVVVFGVAQLLRSAFQGWASRWIAGLQRARRAVEQA